MTIVTSCTSPTIGTMHQSVRCQRSPPSRRMCWRNSVPFGPCMRARQSAQQQRLCAILTGLEPWSAVSPIIFRDPADPKAKQAEQKRGLLMMEFRTFVNFPGACPPSRTNWPSIGGKGIPSIGLERVAVCVPAIGRAASWHPAAPLLMPACRVSRGRHSCRLFKTGIRKSPSAAAPNPRKETSNSSKPSRDPKIGHRHGRTVTFCAPRCRPSDGKCEPAYACLRSSGSESCKAITRPSSSSQSPMRVRYQPSRPGIRRN